VDDALTGDDPAVDVAHQARTQEAMTAPTLAERIDAFADVCVGVAARTGGLFEVAAQAEAVEPEIAAAFAAGRVATVDLCRSFWTSARDSGLLPAEADVDALTVAADVVVAADTTVHLRRTGAWSEAAHRRLVADTLTALTGHLA
jgi:hypothetical protein